MHMLSRQAERKQRERRRLSTLLIGAGVLFLLAPRGLSLWEAPVDNPVIAAAEPTGAAGPLPTADGWRTPAPGPAPTAGNPAATGPSSSVPAPSGGPGDPGGGPLFTLAIDRLGITYPVLEGVDNPQLSRGPGHYPNTSQPGTGNAAIAGHRTVRGKPAFFYAINRLEPGDPIRVIYPDRTLTFRVEQVFVTHAADLTVIAPTDYPALTLTTCDPPGTDERRLIVRARLVESPQL